MTLPSKELLSEVLGCVVTYVYKELDPYNMLHYVTSNVECKLNIYELAHKCNEWAMLEENYTTLINSAVTEGGMGISSIRGDNGEILFCEVMDTEPESIFQACEWILEQR